MEEKEPRVDPAYALDRLSRSMEAARSHPDPSVRDRARARIEAWRAVLDGLASGTLDVGSRQPVSAPVWATLEVLHGGFASGRLLAEVPVSEAEERLVAGAPPASSPRERVNQWWLSDAGLARLDEALRTGGYRVDLPEEGALLVVAWLLERDPVAALDLVAALRPWFARLKFGPILDDGAAPASATVHVATAAEVARQMGRMRPRTQITVMNATLGVWSPLYDRLVALWCETVEGELPCLEESKPSGGWPGARWPAGWTDRRDTWQRDFDAAVRTGAPRGRHGHPRSNFVRLSTALGRAPDLTAADRASVRLALANTLTRHGAPDAAARVALRTRQAETAARPAFHRLSRVVAGRLERHAGSGGIASVASVLGAVEASEDADLAGAVMPELFVRRVRRALEAPVEELVAQGVIRSSETLAGALPQITGQVAAAGIADAALRDLFSRIYAAFRRRRSLLLLHLEHQVGLEELPWIQALEPYRSVRADAPSAARGALEQVTLLALSSFPQTMLPNPLVDELRTLATTAGLALPLVEEVAADIFMGTFTAKWGEAAYIASRALQGSLYARYYDLPAPEAWPSSLVSRVLRWGVPVSEAFASACERRSIEAQTGTGSGVARSGTVLEQAQVLTTQNLAVLVEELALSERVARLAPDLAVRALAWAMTRRLPVRWKSQLRLVKNSAYAWRQGIFFLSLCDEDAQREVLRRVDALLQERSTPWTAQVRPAWEGLAAVVDGGRFGADGRLANGRRFLGWSEGRHWVFGEAPKRPGTTAAPRT